MSRECTEKQIHGDSCRKTRICVMYNIFIHLYINCGIHFTLLCRDGYKMKNNFFKKNIM